MGPLKKSTEEHFSTLQLKTLKGKQWFRMLFFFSCAFAEDVTCICCCWDKSDNCSTNCFWACALYPLCDDVMFYGATLPEVLQVANNKLLCVEESLHSLITMSDSLSLRKCWNVKVDFLPIRFSVKHRGCQDVPAATTCYKPTCSISCFGIPYYFSLFKHDFKKCRNKAAST